MYGKDFTSLESCAYISEHSILAFSLINKRKEWKSVLVMVALLGAGLFLSRKRSDRKIYCMHKTKPTNKYQQQTALKETEQVWVRKKVVSRKKSITDEEYLELKEDQGAIRSPRIIPRICKN